MEALLGAVVGAVLGGALSLVGGVVVARAEVRRAARMTVYREILPPLFAKTTTSQVVEMSDVEALQREALLAGRKDYALALAVVMTTGKQRGDAAFGHPSNDEATDAQVRQFMESSAELEDALETFEKHLVNKLRWRARR
jgi:hypothetical protein